MFLFCVLSTLNTQSFYVTVLSQQCYSKSQVFSLFVNYSLLSVYTRDWPTLGEKKKDSLFFKIQFRDFLNIISYLVTWQTSLVAYALFLNFLNIQTSFLNFYTAFKKTLQKIFSVNCFRTKTDFFSYILLKPALFLFFIIENGKLCFSSHFPYNICM